MTTKSEKQIIEFRLGKLRTMKPAGGRGFRSWLMIFEDINGNVYKTFQPTGNPLMICDNCTITGKVVKRENYLGEEQTVIKNAAVIPPHPDTDTEEAEAEALGDNIALHRQDNPFWWVVEGREEYITEEEVMFVTAAERLTPDQEAAMYEYYGMNDFRHPNEKP